MRSANFLDSSYTHASFSKKLVLNAGNEQIAKVSLGDGCCSLMPSAAVVPALTMALVQNALGHMMGLLNSVCQDLVPY